MIIIYLFLVAGRHNKYLVNVLASLLLCDGLLLLSQFGWNDNTHRPLRTPLHVKSLNNAVM